MNISLTKQELVMLLRLANIGEWVMFANLEGDALDDEPVVQHKKVMQKLFAAANKAKMNDIVEYEPKLKEFFETKEFEEEYLQFIHEYEEDSFWNELSERLATRDMV